MSSSEQGRTSSGRPQSPSSLSTSKASKSDSSKSKKKKAGKQTILSNAHPSPSSAATTASATASSGISATQSANTPCRFFQLGQCNKGSACPFLHKKAAHFSPQACKFYSNGFCRNADTCPFSHDPKIIEAAAAANHSVKDTALGMTPEELMGLPDPSGGSGSNGLSPLSGPLGNGPLSSYAHEAHSGDFNSGLEAGSLELPAFPTGGASLPDSFLMADDVGSFNDTPFSTLSRESSSFEEEGLAAPPDALSGILGGSEPFSLYGSSSTPASYSQQPTPLQSPAGSFQGSTSALASSQPSSSQLHNLLHPSSSPRGILTRRPSSDYVSSSSYSSASGSGGSESSSPGIMTPSPMYSPSPAGTGNSSSGSLKLRHTGHISTTTYAILPPPTLTTPPPTTSAAAAASVAATGGTGATAGGGGGRSPSYSPRSDSTSASSSVASGHMTPGIPSNSSDSLPSGPPHPFRRQSSVQLASSTSKGAGLPSSGFFGSNNGAALPSSSSPSSPGVGSLPNAQFTSVAHGRAPGIGNGPGVGGRPAPFNRSRSTDQGIFPSRFNGLGGFGANPFPEDFSLDRTTTTPSPTVSFFTRPTSSSIPPLVTGYLHHHHHHHHDSQVDLSEHNGNITPTSTSSSVLEQSATLLLSPRSRRPSVSSGAPVPSSSSYLGSDLESYSELGSSDEEDVYFWGDPSAPSYPKRTTATVAPTVHHRFIEGLLEDDEFSPLSSSQSSIVNFTEAVKANRRTSGAMKPSPSSSTLSTLSPSASKSSFGSSGGPPIPMLSRTRKGSFSKSHEDLLANREANLQSPSLFASSSVSGLGFSALVAQGGAAGAGSNQSGYEDSAPSTPTSQGYGMSSSRSSTINSSTSSMTGGTTATTNTSGGGSSSAIPPKLGSFKSQSSVRLVHPSSSLQGPSSHSLASGVMGGPGMIGSGRVPPKLSKIGKSQSETGPAITSSILAWKEKRAAEVLMPSTLPHPTMSDLRIPAGKLAASAANDASGTSSQLVSPSSTSSTASRKQQLCMFFIDGACRYGDSCKFVHGLVCTMCKKPCLFPDDSQQNEKHAKSCRLKIEIEESKDLTCALCKLKVVESNRKFGLLPDCNDIICVPCLKEYRTSTSRAECPVCQAPSHFLIPSHSFPQNPERKRELTEAFKLKMSKIACKYFDYGNGVCKYGQNCHFHHNLEPGMTSTTSTQPTPAPTLSALGTDPETSASDAPAISALP